jgi:LysR family transcriptional regulator, transcriptional activator of nhaA
MSLINYHHLRLFWAVAKEGNLTRASARLHLTPQTVSMQIRELESAIGEDLFVRSGRQLYLTKSGSTALQYANEIFSLGQELTAVLVNKSAARQ